MNGQRGAFGQHGRQSTQHGVQVWVHTVDIQHTHRDGAALAALGE